MDTVIIFGAGDRGRQLFEWKNEILSKDVKVAFVDNDARKWGDMSLGETIHNPNYIEKFAKDTKIVIATADYEEIADSLIGWGYNNLWFMYNPAEIFIQKYTIDCEQLGTAYTIKNDIDSGNLYNSLRTESFTVRLLNELENAEVFVDVGAEFGYYSYAATKKGVRSIHSYEASKYRCNSLRAVYGCIPEIHLHNNAVSDKTGLEVFHQLCHHRASPTMDSSLSLWHRTQSTALSENKVETFEVESVVLDDLLNVENKIDIIKIDIEGAEVLALHGMHEILKQGKTKIFLETHPSSIEGITPGGMEEMNETFKKFGYTIYKTWGMYLKEVATLKADCGRYYLCPPIC